MILEPKKIIPSFAIQHGMTVLDIGSGVGFWAKQIAQLVGVSGKVFAVDNHPDIIRRLYSDIADLGIKNIYPITADITHHESIPIDDHVCDKILIIRMMSYLADDFTETLQMFTKLLKENGEIIIIDNPENIFLAKRFFKKGYKATEMPIIAEKTDGHYSGVRLSILFQ
jgi:ubiquinone/menaquinone biosynthesis C-methylase UbiE